MSEYLLLFASALVSGITNLLGLGRRGGPLRILVVKLDHLGDVVTATPALRALRDAHPHATIDLLAAPDVAPLFEGSPLVTRVIGYDSPRYRRRAAPGPRGRPSLRAIAAAGYDTIVELRGDWATLLLPIQARARRRVDRGTVRLRDRVKRLLGSRRPPLHEVETNLKIVRPLLVGPARDVIPLPEMHVSESARTSMRRLLAQAGIDPDAPIVCVHPGAGWRPRAWRAERFAALGDWIAARYQAQIVYIGSAGERDIEAAIRSGSRSERRATLFGSLALPELAALLQAARLLVGNDSGLVHLAAACGTPTVALFGAQDPRRFRPWSERTITLHHPVPCFPCAQVHCVRPEQPCVNLIEPAEVEAAVLRLLGTQRESAGG